MGRLDLVDSALDQTLRVADERRRRNAVVAACRVAAQTWLSEDELLQRAVRALNGRGPLPTQADLEAHVELLDNTYWDAQDAGTSDEVRRFGHARAAAAVLTALFRHDGHEAAGEAIYEAHHAATATDSQDALVAAREALADR